MKKLLAVLSVGALAALVAPTTAHAQSLNDIPEVGPEICAQWQAMLDEFGPQAAGTPFEPLVDGFQQLHDAACGGGEEEPPAEEPDDGEGDANPLCDPLEQIAAGMEEGGAPAEMSDGVRQIAAGMGCPAPEGGDEPPSDDGDEEAGPHCTVLAEIIAGMEEGGAPAEMIDGFQQIHDGAGCAAGEGDGDTTTTTTAPPTGDDDDDDIEVGGETEVAQTGGGTATPATGGGLLAGGIGLGLIGLATVSRRFFGTT